MWNMTFRSDSTVQNGLTPHCTGTSRYTSLALTTLHHTLYVVQTAANCVKSKDNKNNKQIFRYVFENLSPEEKPVNVRAYFIQWCFVPTWVKKGRRACIFLELMFLISYSSYILISSFPKIAKWPRAQQYCQYYTIIDKVYTKTREL